MIARVRDAVASAAHSCFTLSGMVGEVGEALGRLVEWWDAEHEDGTAVARCPLCSELIRGDAVHVHEDVVSMIVEDSVVVGRPVMLGLEGPTARGGSS